MPARAGILPTDRRKFRDEPEVVLAQICITGRRGEEGFRDSRHHDSNRDLAAAYSSANVVADRWT